MSKSDVYEQGLLDLEFLNAAFAGLGDAGGLQPSAAPGNYYVSLHTASPGEAGDQTTNEVSYGGYGRVAVVRTAAGWVRTGSAVNPVNPINFPVGSSGSQTATHFGLGTAASGAGKLTRYGALSASIPVGTGITPQLSTSTNFTED